MFPQLFFLPLSQSLNLNTKKTDRIPILFSLLPWVTSSNVCARAGWFAQATLADNVRHT